MSEEERIPHGPGLYPFSLALAHAQSRRDIRRALDNEGLPAVSAAPDLEVELHHPAASVDSREV
jgi:hypothetical protein